MVERIPVCHSFTVLSPERLKSRVYELVIYYDKYSSVTRQTRTRYRSETRDSFNTYWEVWYYVRGNTTIHYVDESRLCRGKQPYAFGETCRVFDIGGDLRHGHDLYVDEFVVRRDRRVGRIRL